MWLGSIAGLHRLLMTLISLVFGTYIAFETRVKWIKQMYYFVDFDYEINETSKKAFEVLA